MSLNLRSYRLVVDAIRNKEKLLIDVSRIGGGLLVDFGVNVPGSVQAGIRLSEICLADLATVRVDYDSQSPALPTVQVQTDHPLLACIGAQYAGWEFKQDDFFAMISGPARCLREPLEEIVSAAAIENNERNIRPTKAVAVMESRELPDGSVFQKIAEQCNVELNDVVICVAPTASFAGSLQIVARCIETTIHKLHELGFPITKIKNAIGTAPLPLVGTDDLKSLGWTNDCILYGAQATLWVDATDREIESIGPQVPSCASQDFGTPFLDLFKKYDCDFYKVDPLLFSPAQITLISTQTSLAKSFGEKCLDILRQSMNL